MDKMSVSVWDVSPVSLLVRACVFEMVGETRSTSIKSQNLISLRSSSAVYISMEAVTQQHRVSHKKLNFAILYTFTCRWMSWVSFFVLGIVRQRGREALT